MHSRSPGFSFSYSIFHLWFLLQVVASQSSSSHLSILTNTDRKKQMHLSAILTCLASQPGLGHGSIGLLLHQWSRVMAKGSRGYDILSSLYGLQVHFHVQKVGSTSPTAPVLRIREKLFHKEKSRCCYQKEVINLGPLPKVTDVHCIECVSWS